jgi:hypothetical protein
LTTTNISAEAMKSMASPGFSRGVPASWKVKERQTPRWSGPYLGVESEPGSPGRLGPRCKAGVNEQEPAVE